ncbi:hypothetical protein [Oceanithermus sp.]
MRKALFVAGLVLVFSFASAKAYFGVFSGYPEAIGVQYTMNNNMRFSIGLPAYGGFGVAGSVDMIMGGDALDIEGIDLRYYYGAGASAFFTNYTLYGSAFGFNGHGLAALEWMVPNTNFGIFSEIQLGAEYDTYFGFGPFYGGRFGVNFY